MANYEDPEREEQEGSSSSTSESFVSTNNTKSDKEQADETRSRFTASEQSDDGGEQLGSDFNKESQGTVLTGDSAKDDADGGSEDAAGTLTENSETAGTEGAAQGAQGAAEAAGNAQGATSMVAAATPGGMVTQGLKMIMTKFGMSATAAATIITLLGGSFVGSYLLGAGGDSNVATNMESCIEATTSSKYNDYTSFYTQDQYEMDAWARNMYRILASREVTRPFAEKGTQTSSGSFSPIDKNYNKVESVPQDTVTVGEYKFYWYPITADTADPAHIKMKWDDSTSTSTAENPSSQGSYFKPSDKTDKDRVIMSEDKELDEQIEKKLDKSKLMGVVWDDASQAYIAKDSAAAEYYVWVDDKNNYAYGTFNRGCSLESICGMVANAQMESGLRPESYEDIFNVGDYYQRGNSGAKQSTIFIESAFHHYDWDAYCEAITKRPGVSATSYQYKDHYDKSITTARYPGMGFWGYTGPLGYEFQEFCDTFARPYDINGDGHNDAMNTFTGNISFLLYGNDWCEYVKNKEGEDYVQSNLSNLKVFKLEVVDPGKINDLKSAIMSGHDSAVAGAFSGAFDAYKDMIDEGKNKVLTMDVYNAYLYNVMMYVEAKFNAYKNVGERNRLYYSRMLWEWALETSGVLEMKSVTFLEWAVYNTYTYDENLWFYVPSLGEEEQGGYGNMSVICPYDKSEHPILSDCQRIRWPSVCPGYIEYENNSNNVPAPNRGVLSPELVCGVGKQSEASGRIWEHNAWLWCMHLETIARDRFGRIPERMSDPNASDDDWQSIYQDSGAPGYVENGWLFGDSKSTLKDADRKNGPITWKSYGNSYSALAHNDGVETSPIWWGETYHRTKDSNACDDVDAYGVRDIFGDQKFAIARLIHTVYASGSALTSITNPKTANEGLINEYNYFKVYKINQSHCDGTPDPAVLNDKIDSKKWIEKLEGYDKDWDLRRTNHDEEWKAAESYQDCGNDNFSKIMYESRGFTAEEFDKFYEKFREQYPGIYSGCTGDYESGKLGCYDTHSGGEEKHEHCVYKVADGDHWSPEPPQEGVEYKHTCPRCHGPETWCCYHEGRNNMDVQATKLAAEEGMRELSTQEANASGEPRYLLVKWRFNNLADVSVDPELTVAADPQSAHAYDGQLDGNTGFSYKTNRNAAKSRKSLKYMTGYPTDGDLTSVAGLAAENMAYQFYAMFEMPVDFESFNKFGEPPKAQAQRHIETAPHYVEQYYGTLTEGDAPETKLFYLQSAEWPEYDAWNLTSEEQNSKFKDMFRWTINDGLAKSVMSVYDINDKVHSNALVKGFMADETYQKRCGQVLNFSDIANTAVTLAFPSEHASLATVNTNLTKKYPEKSDKEVYLMHMCTKAYVVAKDLVLPVEDSSRFSQNVDIDTKKIEEREKIDYLPIYSSSDRGVMTAVRASGRDPSYPSGTYTDDYYTAKLNTVPLNNNVYTIENNEFTETSRVHKRFAYQLRNYNTVNVPGRYSNDGGWYRIPKGQEDGAQNQLKYLESSTLWYNVLDGKQVGESKKTLDSWDDLKKLLPGDILISEGDAENGIAAHTMIFVGAEAVYNKYPGLFLLSDEYMYGDSFSADNLPYSEYIMIDAPDDETLERLARAAAGKIKSDQYDEAAKVGTAATHLEQLLKDYLDKYYSSALTIKSTDGKKAIVTGSHTYNSDIKDLLDKYWIKSLDISPSTKIVSYGAGDAKYDSSRPFKQIRLSSPGDKLETLVYAVVSANRATVKEVSDDGNEDGDELSRGLMLQWDTMSDTAKGADSDIAKMLIDGKYHVFRCLNSDYTQAVSSYAVLSRWSTLANTPHGEIYDDRYYSAIKERNGWQAAIYYEDKYDE